MIIEALLELLSEMVNLLGEVVDSLAGSGRG